ncbi:MAG: hypothetical protein WAV90_02430 [Gordonia amarae]
MSTAKIFEQFPAFDLLQSVPTVTVAGADLKAGMVLVDTDLDTPLYGLDHQVRAPRGHR